eukprot:scaffold3725_cov203-Chaetoceros_neogracile.AAC.6
MNATTIMRILCSYNVSERHVDAASTGDTGTAVNAALCNENYMKEVRGLSAAAWGWRLMAN